MSFFLIVYLFILFIVLVDIFFRHTASVVLVR